MDNKVSGLFFPAISGCLVVLLSVFGCGSGGSGITGPNIPDPIEERVLLEVELNASNAAQTVTIDQGMTLVIPKGITPATFTLTIKTAVNAPEMPPDMRAVKLFDIEMSFGSEFDLPLKIRFDFDPDELQAERLKHNFAPVYYDSTTQRWASFFTDFDINFDDGYIEFETLHLTTVGWIELLAHGRQEFSRQPGFRVFYKNSGEDEPGEYSQTKQDWHIPPNDSTWAPVYVQDIAYFMSQAKTAYANAGLTVPTFLNTIVYVKSIGSSGEFRPFSGYIDIKNKMGIEDHTTDVEELRATCAHEFLHLVQDFYYTFAVPGGGANRWWLEATATQGDGMVWPNLRLTESETHSITNRSELLVNLSRSWDKPHITGDPKLDEVNYYLAGCFLQYLFRYRPGQKINIAAVIKAGGEYGRIFSSYVDVLDDEIRTQLGSDIQTEFRKYAEFLFLAGEKKLSAFPYPDGGFNSIHSVDRFNERVSITEPAQKNISISLPYLSAKLIVVTNDSFEAQMVSYKLSKNDISHGHVIGKVSSSNNRLDVIERIDRNGSGLVKLEPKSGGFRDRLVVLAINSHQSGSASVEMEFKAELPEPPPSITSGQDFEARGHPLMFDNSSIFTSAAWEDRPSFYGVSGASDNPWRIGNFNHQTNTPKSTVGVIAYLGNGISLANADRAPDSWYATSYQAKGNKHIAVGDVYYFRALSGGSWYYGAIKVDMLPATTDINQYVGISYSFKYNKVPNGKSLTQIQ